ncbi:hypothetical protein V8D89_009175 [Ganoderma adspersum]
MPSSVSAPTMDPMDSDLSPKIRDACVTARADGYRYNWINSCCIDKSSGSELSEAINSIYAWYAGATVCCTYLADVPAGGKYRRMPSPFRKIRWFTRGWTLQELIAPVEVVFLSLDWATIGSKCAFADLIEEITGICVDRAHRVTRPVQRGPTAFMGRETGDGEGGGLGILIAGDL